MAMSMMDRTKGFITRTLLRKMVARVRNGDEEGLADMFESIARIAPARYHRETFREAAGLVRRKDPSVNFFLSVMKDLNLNSLEKLIQNLLVNFMVVGRGIRDRKMKELDVHLPNFMVISPTMKCNLRCRGCYAAEYDQSDMLSYDELDRILTEGKELGMYFYTFSGGEVLMHPRIFDLWKKHDDCYFQFYTNGTLLDQETVDRLAELGNVAPMVSIEGSREQTEARRGKGVYEKALEAFGRMKKAGMLYGFSATYTCLTADYMSSDDFIAQMTDYGCRVGWFFQYVPIGLKPDLTYMAAPEQRAHLHEKIMEWRSKGQYPIFFGDFWNDGPFVDGCMAGGQRFWHIISNGMVEPCVFVPFAVDNIRGKSIVDIARSPFFRAIREAQPYDDDNLLRPCLILDHPEVMRDLIEKYGAKPCHPGLEEMLSGEVAEGMDSYARRMKEVYCPLWEKVGRPRYLKSLEKEDDEELRNRLERRKPSKVSV